MNANPSPTDRRTDTPTDTEFDAALATAHAVAAYDHPATDAKPLFPETDLDASTVAGAVTWTVSPSTAVAFTAVQEPDAEDVDGATPGADTARAARTLLADPDDEPDLVFSVIETYTNSYDDERVVVETPAPWEMPDSFDGADPNEVIKSLPWGDDDAAESPLDGGAYYDFDSDDIAAPRSASDAWSIEKHAAAELRERALAEGYEWDAGVEADEDGDGDDTLVDRAVAFVEPGDRVTVRYEMKNGNGVASYGGTVLRVSTPGSPYHGFAFEDENEAYKGVDVDDDDEPALFSAGDYPYMGAVVSIEVAPGAGDEDHPEIRTN
jgi:hypothetical protein